MNSYQVKTNREKKKLIKDRGIPLAFLSKDAGSRYDCLRSEIERLQSLVFEIKMEFFPWFFVCAEFTSLESVEEYLKNMK